MDIKNKIQTLIIDDLHPAFRGALENDGRFFINDRPEIKPGAVVDVLENIQLLVVRSKCFVSEELLNQAPQLKAIARAGAGVDNIDVEACNNRQIAIFNAPEGNKQAVAEHVLAQTLALLNHTVTSHLEMVFDKRWNREANRGEELYGKTIGIVGCGHNGSATARVFHALGCRVLGYDKYKKPHEFPSFMESVSLDQIFQQADVVSMHIPLTNETNGFANDLFFHQFEKKIWFINASRGGVLIPDSLIKALENDRVRAAALDVFEQEPPFQSSAFETLAASRRVLFSPHVAGWSTRSYQKISTVLAEKVINATNEGLFD